MRVNENGDFEAQLSDLKKINKLLSVVFFN